MHTRDGGSSLLISLGLNGMVGRQGQVCFIKRNTVRDVGAFRYLRGSYISAVAIRNKRFED